MAKRHVYNRVINSGWQHHRSMAWQRVAYESMARSSIIAAAAKNGIKWHRSASAYGVAAENVGGSNVT